MKPLVLALHLLWFTLVSALPAAAQSLFIPGGVNYVEVGDLDVPGNQITIEAIVTMTGGGVNIVSKHTGPTNVNYLMRPGSAEITTTNGYVNAVTGFPLVIGECYHLAFTYNGISLDYYVNGCLASSTPHTGDLVTNDFTTGIGDISATQTESWVGYIDEVRIWNVARTQADIQANMTTLPTPATQPGLLAYYDFNGTFNNIQGNAAWNGTPIGNPQLQANAACQNVNLSFQNQVTTTDVSCNGGADGSVTITSSGGHPNYTYSPDGTNFFPQNTIGNLPVGNGFVWAQSGANSGCLEQIPITIGEPSAITTSVIGADPNCVGGNDGEADLTVNGGTPPYTYSWTSGSTQEDPTNLTVGNNTVTITDANACITTESIVLNDPPPITLSIVGTDPSCNNGSDGTADLTVNNGTAPFTFSWSNGSALEDPIDLSAGTTVVNITDANGCTANDNVTLGEPTAVLPNAFSNFVSSQGACDGTGTANPSGGTPPYTYLWDDGQTTQVATGLCEGGHSVTVTDANGCTGFQNITVNLPACLTDVDFFTWQQAGQPANGNWVVENAGARVRQTVNGNPTFFVTPTDYINVRMRGKMRTTDGDDDFMGVVFGFQNPLGASDLFDMWLFDWKQGPQNGAQEGFALSNANGVITNYQPTFWEHTNTPEFNVVATDFGNNGWTRNVDHEIEVTYTVNRAIILVDGDTIFDVFDCFEPGRFGFYNYSQQQVIYSDFTYELFADFIVETPEVCAGDTAEFTFLEQCGNFNNLSQFDELQWDFGDGNTENVSNITLANVNPTHVYEDGGSYTVRMIALDTLGCRDTVYNLINVLQNPTVDFTFDDQCFLDNTQFTDASIQGDYPIAGYAWLIDGNQVIQQNTSYQFPAPGTYTVGLGVEDTYGCQDTALRQVVIHELPNADFLQFDTCYSENYLFTDQSAIGTGTVDNWQWDFGDGSGTSNQQNPTYTYADFGQWDVTLIALSDQGCGDTITQTVRLRDNPVAGFEIPNICQLEPMQFLDTATIGEGAIVSWDYDFGDGSGSTDQNPFHSYADAGQTNINQIVTSDFGCETSITVAATVDPKPVADFATENVCLNETMDFQDQSAVVSGSIISWEWDFGDANTDQEQNTSNPYSNFGNYTVELMVETDNGCRDTTEQEVEVYQLPVADFDFSDVCLDAAATFTDQSTSNSGSVDTWNWNFGDGTIESGQGPIQHDYPLPDTYTVELIVETDFGCFDTLNQSIIVYPMPLADFSADSVCFNEITTFSDLTSILSGTVMNHAWDFGFSGLSNQSDPTFTFPETGYHPVFLTVTSDFGCKDTITKAIRVYVLPEPEFTHNDTCFEDLVTFVNQSTISEGTIDQYDWYFGDLNTSNLTDPVHNYTAADFYQTELTATSNFGCTESVSHSVEIFPLPTVEFTSLPAEGCQPLTVTFDNESNIQTGYFIDTYEWDFGNGQSSTGLNPQILYPDSGLYDVQLIVTSDNGCDDTLFVQDAIDVWPRPIAGFVTDKDSYTMYLPTVRIEDESFGATEWNYDFGDGSSSLEQNPVHEYQEAGTYQIIQYVNNDFGCDDETSTRVIVEPIVTLYIPNAFTPNNDDINDVWKPDGVGIEEYELRIFNRWGQEIFQTSNLDQGWDGSYMGKQVESGLYLYSIFVMDIDRISKVHTGELHLVR